jgi:hypothetical protein
LHRARELLVRQRTGAGSEERAGPQGHAPVLGACTRPANRPTRASARPTPAVGFGVTITITLNRDQKPSLGASEPGVRPPGGWVWWRIFVTKKVTTKLHQTSRQNAENPGRGRHPGLCLLRMSSMWTDRQHASRGTSWQPRRRCCSLGPALGPAARGPGRMC